MNFGTWNILSWYRAEAAKRAIQQLDKNGMDIVALQEIRWPDSGSITVDKYTILYSGSIDGRHEFGTGFAVKEHLRNLIISFKPINERLCYIRIKGK